MQALENSNLRKKRRREVFPWDPGRIWKKNWSLQRNEETNHVAEKWKGNLHFLPNSWLVRREGKVESIEAQWRWVTPEDFKGKYTSITEQWMPCPATTDPLGKYQGTWMLDHMCFFCQSLEESQIYQCQPCTKWGVCSRHGENGQIRNFPGLSAEMLWNMATRDEPTSSAPTPWWKWHVAPLRRVSFSLGCRWSHTSVRTARPHLSGNTNLLLRAMKYVRKNILLLSLPT